MPDFAKKEDVNKAIADVEDRSKHLMYSPDLCVSPRMEAEIEHLAEVPDVEVAARVGMRINLKWLLHCPSGEIKYQMRDEN